MENIEHLVPKIWGWTSGPIPHNFLPSTIRSTSKSWTLSASDLLSGTPFFIRSSSNFLPFYLHLLLPPMSHAATNYRSRTSTIGGGQVHSSSVRACSSTWSGLTISVTDSRGQSYSFTSNTESTPNDDESPGHRQKRRPFIAGSNATPSGFYSEM